MDALEQDLREGLKVDEIARKRFRGSRFGPAKQKVFSNIGYLVVDKGLIRKLDDLKRENQELETRHQQDLNRIEKLEIAIHNHFIAAEDVRNAEQEQRNADRKLASLVIDEQETGKPAVMGDMLEPAINKQQVF